MSQGFRTHLTDAIRLNTARQPFYMERTQGASRSLSEELVATERLALPIAAYFDWRGRRLEGDGVPVVSGAFVPMDVPEADAPTQYGGKAGPGTIRAAAQLLADVGKQVRAALWLADFDAMGHACEEALVRLDEMERISGSHFAMCKHLVESLGLGALNGIACAEATGGRSTALSRDLVGIQLLALGKAPDADRRAQEFHAMGAGILVNDMPAIPFLDRWRETM